MTTVKTQKRAEPSTIADRLAVLLGIFSPWDGISLTYRQFAAELGKPVTPVTIKKWPQRQKFPAEAARLIVAKAKARGLAGVTLEWVLWGDGTTPQRGPTQVQNSPAPTLERTSPETHPEAHGQFATQVGHALEADLSHNEFGQWSSIEAQHTVIWALKDLARRLRVLKFDMGNTFDLTDEWAGHVGLPVLRDGSAEGPGDHA